MTNPILKACEDSLIAVKISYESQKNLKKEADKLASQLKYDYNNKIYDLEKERDTKINEVLLENEATIQTMVTNLEKDKANIAKVKGILTMMDLVAENPVKQTPEVYYYSDKDLNGNYIPNKRKVPIPPIKSLVDDKYTNILLFILPNRKPVKKYSLVIWGNTIFGDVPNAFSRGYVSGIQDADCNIKILVKDAVSKAELTEYANNPKNLSKLLSMIPPTLPQLATEFEEAKVLIQDKDWKIAYLRSKILYYEEDYHRGTEQPEYAALQKELAKLLK